MRLPFWLWHSVLFVNCFYQCFIFTRKKPPQFVFFFVVVVVWIENWITKRRLFIIYFILHITQQIYTIHVIYCRHAQSGPFHIGVQAYRTTKQPHNNAIGHWLMKKRSSNREKHLYVPFTNICIYIGISILLFFFNVTPYMQSYMYLRWSRKGIPHIYKGFRA